MPTENAHRKCRKVAFMPSQAGCEYDRPAVAGSQVKAGKREYCYNLPPHRLVSECRLSLPFAFLHWSMLLAWVIQFYQ